MACHWPFKRQFVFSSSTGCISKPTGMAFKCQRSPETPLRDVMHSGGLLFFLGGGGGEGGGLRRGISTGQIS